MKEIPRMSGNARILLVCAMVVALAASHTAEGALVSYWAAEGNPNDSAGPNSGTAVDTVTYSAGKFGQAFGLAGTGYISITTPVTGELESVSGFTVAAWIFRDGVGSIWGTASLANLRTTANTSGFTLEEVYTQPSTIGFIVNTTGVKDPSYATYGITATGWNVGEYQHIAATFDAATHTLVLYRDGEVVASRNDMPGSDMIANASSAFQIGQNIVNNSRWNGRIDEMRFYDTALSQSEIQQMMTIPEPGTLGLFGLAVACGVLRKWRRRSGLLKS